MLTTRLASFRTRVRAGRTVKPEIGLINNSRLCHDNASKDWTSLSSYEWFLPFQTRWKDNDQYGHVNNAVYQSWFDSAVNVYLVRFCGLDVRLGQSDAVAFIAENRCHFHKPVAYPGVYLVGTTVSHLGNSSIRYQNALFAPRQQEQQLEDFPALNLWTGYFGSSEVSRWFETSASATGSFVHVVVAGDSAKTMRMPEKWREQLGRISG